MARKRKFSKERIEIVERLISMFVGLRDVL